MLNIDTRKLTSKNIWTGVTLALHYRIETDSWLVEEDKKPKTREGGQFRFKSVASLEGCKGCNCTPRFLLISTFFQANTHQIGDLSGPSKSFFKKKFLKNCAFFYFRNMYVGRRGLEELEKFLLFMDLIMTKVY